MTHQNRPSFHTAVVTGEPAPLTDGFRLTGTVFEGRFEVEREIGEGGFAVVYRARHLGLDRPVALKVLKTPLAHGEKGRAEFQERFAAEAKTIARLKHPHIVDVYDFAIGAMPNGQSAPWMALEWLDGETLATQLLRRRHDQLTGLPAREALDLLRPVIQALAFAHGQGIVHRDIKPANIMVIGGDSKASLRVLDFGIAKMVDADRPAGSGDTRTDSIPTFTPSYAAPEQVAYSRTGAWTDVHALGLILAELLTDTPPYAASDAHLFEQVMSASRPTPKSKGRHVGAFEPVIAKALALSPRERWADAGELLDALEQAASLEGPTVRMGASRAPAPAPAGRSALIRRRRSALILSVGAVAIAALASTARKGHPPAAPHLSVAPAKMGPVPDRLSPAEAEATLPAVAATAPPAIRQAVAEPKQPGAARTRHAAPRAAITPASAKEAKNGPAADLFDDLK